MAETFRVTCITPDGADQDQRIDAIGGSSGGGWKLPIDDAIHGIETGKWAFFTSVAGKDAWIIVAERPNGRKYLNPKSSEYLIPLGPGYALPHPRHPQGIAPHRGAEPIPLANGLLFDEAIPAKRVE